GGRNLKRVPPQPVRGGRIGDDFFRGRCRRLAVGGREYHQGDQPLLLRPGGNFRRGVIGGLFAVGRLDRPVAVCSGVDVVSEVGRLHVLEHQFEQVVRQTATGRQSPQQRNGPLVRKGRQPANDLFQM